MVFYELSTFEILRFKICLLNLINYLATSIFKYVMQVVINTGVLTWIHNPHQYLLKKNTNISEILTNLTNQRQKNSIGFECKSGIK